MAIRVVCPECGAAYGVNDELRGKRIRCRSCQAVIQVGASPGARPVEAIRKEPAKKAPPPRPRDEDDEAEVVERTSPRRRKGPAPTQKSNLPLVLGLAGGAAALVVVGVVALVLWMAWNSGTKVQGPNTAHQASLDLEQPPFGRFPPVQPDAGAQPRAEDRQPVPEKGAPPAKATGDTAQRIYKRLLKSVVLVLMGRRRGGGQVEIVGIGSGTLIDKTNRLVLTNHHVAAGGNEFLVFFPVYKNGRLVAEQSDFLKNVDIRRNALSATVLMTQPERDLALMKLDRLPEGVEALPLAKTRPNIGDPVYSVGHPGAGGGFWIFTDGVVRSCIHRHYETGSERMHFTVDADVVLTTSPTNHGDSGGPLVNNRGEMIAVVQGGTVGANLMSLFIDVKEVPKILDKCVDQYSLKLDLPTGRGIEADTSGLPDLMAALTDADVNKRRKAAQALGEVGPDAKIAVPNLILALKDKDDLVRRFSRSSLDRIGPPTKNEVAPLVDALDDSNPTVRLRVLDALGKVGPDAQAAVPAVKKALKDTDPKVRTAAVRAFGRLGSRSREAVLPSLSEAVRDGDRDVRLAAAEVLVSDVALDRSDVPLLLDLLKQPDVEVRVQAALAVKKIGPDARDARAPLLAALKDPSADLRRAAMEALVVLGLGKDSLPVLEAALKDPDAEVRRNAIDAAARLGADARSLIPLVADGVKDWHTRKNGLEALAKFGPAARSVQVLGVLDEALADEKYRVQAAAAVVAIRPTGPEGKVVVAKLLTLLELPPTPANQEVRARAIEALGKTGRNNALFELEKRLTDPKPWIKLGAISALGEMGPDARQALGLLVRLQATDESGEVREAVTEAIKKIRAGR